MNNPFDAYRGQSVHIGHLQSEFSRGEMAHAYLLTGPSGTGKKSVAMLLAQTAVCCEKEKPCQACGPCQRVAAGTHPDVRVLTPEEKKRDIGVGQMRTLLEQAQIRAQEGGMKVFLIPDADRMNAAAQNALLKTLEEPPADTVFVLTSSRPSLLLSTIVSRCRIIRFHPLTEDGTRKRLRELGIPENEIGSRARLCEGCIGRALSMKEDAMQRQQELAQTLFSVRSLQNVAEAVKTYKDEKETRMELMEFLEETLREILQIQSGAVREEETLLPAVCRSYARSVPVQGGIALMEKQREARKMINSNVAFGSVIESILLAILEEYRQWPW